MGTGIAICGLNGAGKSTLGRALATALGFHFIDIEDLYFPRTDPHYTYASPRTRDEVQKLLLHEMNAHESFVLASVTGDYGEAFHSSFQYAVLVSVPKEIRLRRVKDRSFQKFGDRMLPGGDLYEREEKFFDLVKSRTENMVEDWVQTLDCPIIRIDGTKPVEENTKLIIKRISE